MKLGICLPHYGRPIETGRMLEVARRAEDRGLDSIWVTDHVIVPEQANVIYREHMLDPLAVLPWLAGVTSRVARLGDGWHASSMNHDLFRQGADSVRQIGRAHV